MTGKTHLTAGILSGVVANTLCNLPPGIALFTTVSCALGSLLPDIDMPSTTAAKAIKPLSTFIFKTLGHRTITHGIFLWLIIYVILSNFFPHNILVYFSMLGVTSHLILDMLNRKGVPLFWPIKKRFYLIKIKTGGNFEYGFRVFLLVLTAFAVIVYLSKNIFIV